ncbi:unnamed protein product [Effrenium voratum]|nr:unnamed protein product [Effrenium voratum]
MARVEPGDEVGARARRRAKTRSEKLLRWLEGEELFNRSSPLERSITIAIFGILVASVGFAIVHGCFFGGGHCDSERARRLAAVEEAARLRPQLQTARAHSHLSPSGQDGTGPVPAGLDGPDGQSTPRGAGPRPNLRGSEGEAGGEADGDDG